MAFLFAFYAAVIALFSTNAFTAAQRFVNMGDPQELNMMDANDVSVFGNNGLAYENNQLISDPRILAQPPMGSQSFGQIQTSGSFGNTMNVGQQIPSTQVFSGQQAAMPMVVPQSAGFQSPMMLAPSFASGNGGAFGSPLGHQSSSSSSLLTLLLLTSTLGSSSSSSSNNLLLPLVLISALGNGGSIL